MEYRPDSILDFLVWIQRKKTDGEVTTAEIKAIGLRVFEYMEFADKEEQKRLLNE